MGYITVILADGHNPPRTTPVPVAVDDTLPLGQIVPGLVDMLQLPAAHYIVRLKDGAILPEDRTISESGLLRGQRLVLEPAQTLTEWLTALPPVRWSAPDWGAGLEARLTDVERLLPVLRQIAQVFDTPKSSPDAILIGSGAALPLVSVRPGRDTAQPSPTFTDLLRHAVCGTFDGDSTAHTFLALPLRLCRVLQGDGRAAVMYEAFAAALAEWQQQRDYMRQGMQMLAAGVNADIALETLNKIDAAYYQAWGLQNTVVRLQQIVFPALYERARRSQAVGTRTALAESVMLYARLPNDYADVEHQAQTVLDQIARLDRAERRRPFLIGGVVLLCVVGVLAVFLVLHPF